MGETHYLISDASKKVDVEAHVLRYWEEELELQIPRNEMGHRYYTDQIIHLFCQVKEMKENGYQLKAIKNVLPNLMASDKADTIDMENFIGPMPFVKDLHNTVSDKDHQETSGIAAREEESEMDADDKMMQFQRIMGNIISQALKENAGSFSQEVGGHVSERVIKEMDYQMRVREEREEERFKKLDETLRAYQKGQKSRAEAAAAKMPPFKAKKKKKFGRNGNKLF